MPDEKDKQDQQQPRRESVYQLTRNVAGHFVGETFTPSQAEAAGLGPEHFRPFPGQTDRAVKGRDTTTR